MDGLLVRPTASANERHRRLRRHSGIDQLLSTVNRLANDVSLSLFGQEKIQEIRLTGNRRIEADAIMRYIRSKPGDDYVPKSLSDDLKSVYSMGYFEDIRIERIGCRVDDPWRSRCVLLTHNSAVPLSSR